MMEPIMVNAARENFSSQAAPEVLAGLRQIADAQGRQLQSVLDEALRDYIDRHQKARPRRHALTSFAASLDEFDSLYCDRLLPAHQRLEATAPCDADLRGDDGDVRIRDV